MKVSIVMCAYNVAPYIEEAIASVLAQTHRDWELIISDDHSTDNTVALIKPFLKDPRIRLIEQPVNLGYLENKNAAFRHVTGDFITQLDSDDTCPPERLEKAMIIFDRHPGMHIIGTNHRLIDEKGKEISSKTYEHDFIIKEVSDDYPFWFATLIFRRHVLEEVGLFHPYFKESYGDDHYWAMKANRVYPIYFLRDVLYNYRIHQTSLTATFDNLRKLIVPEVIIKLYEQIRDTGTDWLSLGEDHKLLVFEEALLADKTFMSEKYRLWAAKAVDNSNWKVARKLLRKSLSLDIANLETLKTCGYYLRKRYLKLT